MILMPRITPLLGRRAIWTSAAILFTVILVIVLARPIDAKASSLDASSVGSGGDVTVFIADRENHRVVSVPAVGGPVTELVTGLAAPHGLAVSGDTLYIVDAGNSRVVSVPVSGGPVTELVSGLSFPSGIAVADGTMYITEPSRIVSAPIDGGVATEVAAGLGGPFGIAVSGDTLFVTMPASDLVVSMPTSGGAISEVTNGVNAPNSVAVSGGSVYVTNFDQKVVTLGESGGPVSALSFVASLGDIEGIAVVEDRMFFADQSNNRVVSASTGGGAVTELVTGLDTPSGVAVSDGSHCQGSSCVPVVGSLFGSLG